MAVNDTNRALKAVLGLEATDENKRLIEEFGAETINVAAKEIWSDDIDPTPAQAVIDGTVALETLHVLTEDVTVPNQQAWRATFVDWIPPTKFGTAYVLQLFDATNTLITVATQINKGIFFDYKTGLLTADDVSGIALPFKITHHRYIGIKGAGGSVDVVGTPTVNQAAVWDTATDIRASETLTVNDATGQVDLALGAAHDRLFTFDQYLGRSRILASNSLFIEVPFPGNTLELVNGNTSIDIQATGVAINGGSEFFRLTGGSRFMDFAGGGTGRIQHEGSDRITFDSVSGVEFETVLGAKFIFDADGPGPGARLRSTTGSRFKVSATSTDYMEVFSGELHLRADVVQMRDGAAAAPMLTADATSLTELVSLTPVAFTNDVTFPSTLVIQSAHNSSGGTYPATSASVEFRQQNGTVDISVGELDGSPKQYLRFPGAGPSAGFTGDNGLEITFRIQNGDHWNFKREVGGNGGLQHFSSSVGAVSIRSAQLNDITSPSYTWFEGANRTLPDYDTGMSYGGSDTMGLVAGGEALLRLDNDTKRTVSIGGFDPAADSLVSASTCLHVRGTGNSHQLTRAVGASSAEVRIASDTGNGFLNFFNNNSSRWTLGRNAGSPNDFVLTDIGAAVDALQVEFATGNVTIRSPQTTFKTEADAQLARIFEVTPGVSQLDFSGIASLARGGSEFISVGGNALRLDPVAANGKLSIGSDFSTDATNFIPSTTFDQFLMAPGTGMGRQIILTDQANEFKDHGHPTTANPSLWIHSVADPTITTNEYMRLEYDDVENTPMITSGFDLGIRLAEDGGSGSLSIFNGAPLRYRFSVTGGGYEFLINGSLPHVKLNGPTAWIEFPDAAADARIKVLGDDQLTIETSTNSLRFFEDGSDVTYEIGSGNHKFTGSVDLDLDNNNDFYLGSKWHWNVPTVPNTRLQLVFTSTGSNILFFSEATNEALFFLRDKAGGKVLSVTNRSPVDHEFGAFTDLWNFRDAADTQDTTAWRWNLTTDQHTYGVDSNIGRQLILTDYDNVDFDHGHVPQANPTFYVHSVAASTDEWVSLAHDGTDGILDLGSGNLLVGTDANGPAIANVAASTTVPTLIPNRTRPTTGIGQAASDSLYFMTAGVTRLQIDNSSISSGILHGFNSFVRGSSSGAPVRISSGGNPTVIPLTGNGNALFVEGDFELGGDFIVPNGFAAKYLYELNLDISASPNNITAEESGKLFTNTGITAENRHVLPTAVGGLVYRFYNDDADGMRIDANTADDITDGVTTAGQIDTTEVGAYLELVAVNASLWKVVVEIGAWAIS